MQIYVPDEPLHKTALTEQAFIDRLDAVLARMDREDILAGFAEKAPDLIFHAPVRIQTGTVNQDIIIETGKLEAAHTILLF